MRRKYLFWLVMVMALVFLQYGTVQARWAITQVTDNTTDDMEPVVNKTHIAWQARDAVNNIDVYAYDGSTVTRLTNSAQNEQNLFAGSGYIAWNWRDFTNGDDIFLYDGSTVHQITDDGNDNFRPMISGQHMVWGRSVNDVLLYDIVAQTAPVQLISPGGTGNELDPYIEGNSVSWTSNEGDSEIYFYDIPGASYTKLTDNGLPDYESVINDSYVAWVQYDKVQSDPTGDREIMLYERSTTLTAQLTDNSVSEGSLVMDGSYLAWISNTGSGSYDDELYVHDADTGATALVASNVSYTATPPSISGNLLVYQGHDGNDSEIYIYDFSTGITTQLTNNAFSDLSPQVREDRIVWYMYDGLTEGSGDYEVMLAIERPFFPWCLYMPSFLGFGR